MKTVPAFAASALIIVLAGHAGIAAAAAPAMTSGNMLTDPSGMTLYTYDNDHDGKSACTGGCASNWPPFAASAGAKPEGDYTIVDRSDGKRQWAYKGKPLYSWSKDKKPGDKTGDGFKNVWHAAHP